MDQTERAVILKTGRFREADLWVRLLTPSQGVFTAFAFGGCKSRRRFCGCLEPMNQVLVHLKSNKTGEYLAMTESSLVHSPRRLRGDAQRLGLAVNCLKFLDALTIDQDVAPGVYALFLDALRALDQADAVPASFPVLFRGRLAFDLGFCPELDVCCSCGMPHPPGGALDVEAGRIACFQCAGKTSGLELPLSPGGLTTLQTLRHKQPDEWCGLCVAPDDLRQGLQAVESYVRYHLGLAWDRQAFRKI